MYIEHLSLSNFRNYARLELGLPTNNPVVLHGQNAQGKTSLLESIYYLATAKSPYNAADRQLIHWRAENDPIPFARLSAEICSQHAPMNRLEMTLMIERTVDGVARLRKVIKVNGVDKRVMDIVGLLNVVLFLPHDLSLVEGSPSDRRRFMDNTLGQVDAAYLNAIDTYEKILPQRNALLKRINDRQASPKELRFWDEQIVAAGSIIIAGRQKFLRELEIRAQDAHLDLTGKREVLTLRYQPSFLPTFAGDGQLSFDTFGLDLHRELTPDEIAPQFGDKLKAEEGESIHRGVTLCGPHRDELRLFINERDSGLYGSRGQARTAVMAIKLAELQWMRDRIGEYPVLLLDEVVAELDSQRRAYLLERIDGVTQTLVTTTELDIFTRPFLDRAAIWRVTDGRIDIHAGEKPTP
ncbi:MAG: DNA replication/repair protein RecF [Anaerolineae bacterium]|uniref:DNA replication/repair protein RecF n=1 Tax=Candidatus Flexifilum breve TaxID=3140694 RepID=UPI001ACE3743|nr:DNA replication/repair protein RecF [Chloroflexota bacterium]MBN8634692.1 DNA replication/repair protein RecF [Anaerolineae bacterium]